MSDADRGRRDESRSVEALADEEAEVPEHRFTVQTFHAVKYIHTEAGFEIDPNQTITAEVDTTPGAGAPPEPPTAPPVNVDIPLVSGPNGVGDASEGQVLTCTMGNWNNVPSSYSYGWHTDGSPNSAIGSTYTVVAGDVGTSLTCVVTATNALGSTAAPPSNAVAVV